MERHVVDRIGVLLVNLGTPDQPQASAIRRWLGQFLRDPRVVEIPRWLWLPILNGVILPFRPFKLVSKYRSVWMEQGSPLMVYSRAQQAALQEALPDMQVMLAMRYGQPSLDAVLTSALKQGLKRLLVLPLYPQYAASTTATTFDAIADCLRGVRALPELRCIASYYQDEAYLAALAASVQTHWQKNGRAERLLMSFHGLPQVSITRGDPYAAQCEATAALLAQQLGMKSESWQLCYQSRLGRAKWLQPYAQTTVVQLAQQGVKTLDVLCPGFSVDCLETLEEIQMELRDAFIAAGGKSLRYIPALNAEPTHIRALASLVQRHTRGW